MTRFKDGPAKGKTLMLKRAPIFLRVVVGPDVDALDQPDDQPRAGETVFAYQLTGEPGHVHLNMGRGRGGFYPLAEYRLVTIQPTAAQMRSTGAWAAWCEAHRHLTPLAAVPALNNQPPQE